MRLFPVIRTAFDPGAARDRWAILAYAFFALSFGWFVNSTTALWERLGEWAFGCEWGKHAFPAMLLVAAFGALWLVTHRVETESAVKEVVPAPHAGLVSHLSAYGASSPWKREEVASALSRIEAAPDTALRDLQKNELRTYLLASNWGPLWAAREHHAEALRFCVLICTSRVTPKPAIAGHLKTGHREARRDVSIYSVA